MTRRTDPNDDLSPVKRALLAVQELQAKLDAVELARTEPIAIVGLGCRFPGGADSPEAFWNLLLDGVDAVREVPSDRWDIDAYYDPDPSVIGKMATRWGGFLDQVDQFDPEFFGLSPREAARMDPQQRLLLEVAWEALERAALPPDRLAGSRTGVFVGLYNNDYAQRLGGTNADAHVALGNSLGIAAGRLSHLLDLHGPSLVVDTLCSSSLVTVHLACQSLRTGESDLALAGGVNVILSPASMIMTSRLLAMAPDGRCKTFDARADGFVRGEGCGLVVLKRLGDALRDGDAIWAVVRGSAVNQDGRSTDLTAPNVLAQQAVLRAALRQAQVAPETVGYIEAHGTGTALGDPIEVAALSAVYGQPRPDGAQCLLGSVKTNLGHLEAAAGIAGLIKTILMLRHGAVPPHLHFRRLNPRITLSGTPFAIPTALTPWPAAGQPRRAGVSAFGMSGTNAHVIVEEAPAAVTASDLPAGPQLLTLSARTPEALAVLAERYAQLLAAPDAPDWISVCATSHQGRAHFSERLAVVAGDALAAAGLLDKWRATRHVRGVQHRRAHAAPKIAFLFPGQGLEFAGVGHGLYARWPVFRAAMDRCAALLTPYLDADLAAVLWAETGSALAGQREQPAFIQPALVALEWALAEQLRAWGVLPSAVLGHSLGEYAAAMVAGALSVEDGLRLAAERGRQMGALPASGAMTAVEADVDWAQRLLERLGSGAVIAAENAPQRVVVAGTTEEVQRIEEACAETGVRVNRLKVSHAFHSPLMEPMVGGFGNVLERAACLPARLPVVSGQWGRVVEAGDVLGADYWLQQLRQPVKYAAGVRALAGLGIQVLVEVGPGGQLSGLGQMSWDESEHPAAMWVTPLRGKGDEQSELLAGLGQLYTAGAPIDWAAVDGPAPHRAGLPTYPFQRQRYWVDLEAPQPVLEVSPGQELPGRRLDTALDGAVYTLDMNARQQPFLDDHQLGGERVVPGAYYVALALAAARDSQRVSSRLDEVLFEAMLAVGADEQRLLQLTLTPASDGAQDVRILSRGPEADTWTLHARATLRPDAPLVKQQPESLAAIQARCSELVDPAAFYDQIAERGLALGRSLRWIDQLWRGEGEALARVRVPAMLQGLDPRQHPGLLDAGLQVAAALLPVSDQEGTLYLPFGIDSVQDWNASWGAAAFIHAHLRPAASDSATRSADIVVLDETGHGLLRLTGVTLARAPQKAAASERPAPLFEVSWQTLQLASDTAAANARSFWLVGDHASDSVARALARALEAAEQVPELLDVSQAAARLRAGDADRLAGLVLLTGLDAETPSAERIAELLPLELLHRLLAVPNPPRLWLLSAGAQTPGPLASTPHPLQALRAGLALALAHEHPGLRATVLDLDPALPLAAQAPALAARLLTPDSHTEPRQALRGGNWLVPRLAPAAAPPAGQVQLARPASGTLDELKLTPLSRPAPGPGQVEIAVHAAGLNFRDVLNALGELPGGGSMGGECAGRIVALGDGVEGLTIGQRVVALAPGSLATHVTVPAALVAPIPAELDWASAAALPLVMLTVRLALRELAGLRAGQAVLIHSAAGGVGLAAVQWALSVGAVVVATAGSQAKRALLAGLGVTAVANSRDPRSYAAAVAEATGGRGVDVVLNALSGDAIGVSLDVLRPGGLFVEMGQRGIWSAEAVAARRVDVRYAVINLLALTREEPRRVGGWLRELMAGVAEGTIAPLPVRTWPLTEAASAFRTLAAGQHVGKLVLAVPQPTSEPLARDDSSYLITGGRGALGLAAAEWLVGQGARHLALLSRSGPDESQAAVIERLRAAGAGVLVLQADVADPADVQQALQQVRAALPPLRGVLHAAGVVEDGLLARQGRGEIERVLAPKLMGAWALQGALAGEALDWWINCSSAAGLLGQIGQAGYAAANAVLDALAHQQRSLGQPGLSVNWGPIGGGGLAARAGAGVQAGWAAAGVGALPLAAVGPTLRAAWTHGQAQLAAIVWRNRAGRDSQTEIPPLLSQLFRAAPTAPAVEGIKPSEGSLTEVLIHASDGQRSEILLSTLRTITAELLELPTGEAVDPERPLRELGLDSLLAVELRNRLARLLGRPLPATLLFDYPTLARLAAHLIANVLALATAAPAVPAAPRPAAEVSTEAIAIVGIGCRFPGGADSPEAYWRMLADGVDAVREVPPDRWDVDAYYDPDPNAPGKMITRFGAFLDQVDQFDAAFFGIAPREAMAMDPQQRLLLEMSWEALERAGIAPASLAGSQTGVFVGLSATDYAQLQMGSGNVNDIYIATGSVVSVAAGRLSYVLGLQGPAMAVDTACSSALVAVHLACQSLRAGECNLALAGGVNAILTPMATINFSHAQMMAPDGRCKTFDARADGYVRGEGGGVVVLKRLSEAVRDGDPIWAVVRGSAVNQDGRSNGLTAPNGPAQEAVIRTALAQAGVAPAAVGYVEAHGTGTALGDPIEMQALAAVLGAGRPAEQPLWVGSVKTNFGHLEAAAGMAGLIKSVLALQQRAIPPHLHFETPSAHIPWADIPVTIPTQLTEWTAAEGPRLAGVSAFGLSGTNAHVVLEEPPRAGPRSEATPAGTDRPRHLLVLSAKSPEALRQMARHWADFLTATPDAPLADICHTAAAGRNHFDHRLAVAAETASEAREKLSAYARGEAAGDVWQSQPGPAQAPRVAFLFTGQGAQLAGVGRQLYATQPAFRRALDRCAAALGPLLDQPLLDLLYGAPDTTALLGQTRYAQPALFALEWALAELWEGWGVAPGALLGHSLGEYVAACRAGVFSVEDGLRLVVARGQMMETAGAGAMLAVFAAPERVRPALAQHADTVSIAAINGPSETVIAVQGGAVDEIRQALAAAGIACRALPVNYAFHSPLLDPVLDTLAEAAAGVAYGSPRLNVIANLTGAVARDGELTTAAYWRRQAREPVLFGQGVETLRTLGCNVFIEVGPQSTLLRLGQRLPGAESARWLPTLDPTRDDWSQLLESLGRLYAASVDVDWQAFDRDYTRRRVVLPTYPFQRERYWFEHKPPTAPAQPVQRALLGRRLSSPVMKDAVFETHISAASPAFLAHHQVGTTVVMPGAGYAVMMLEAARQALRVEAIDLSEVTFTEALPLPEGEARTTQVIVTPSAAGAAEIRFFSRPSHAPDDLPWTLHAQATAGPSERGSNGAEPPSAEIIAARCTQALAGADFYALAAERGMNFGPQFQWIENLGRGTDEAIGYLRPARPTDTVEGCPIHPGLVDACFQLLAAAAPAGPAQSVAIPAGFGRLRLHDPAAEPLWGHAQVNAVNGSDPGLVVGTVKLYGAQGLVLALEGLRLRHVPRRALVAETVRSDWLHELVWTPVEKAAVPDAVQPAGTWLILADHGGCAEDLQRLLAAHGQRSVTVLAGDECQPDGDRRWRVDPRRRDDFAHVLRAALPEGEVWRGVVHLWGLAAAGSETDLFSTRQELMCASALHLTQALAATNGTPRLWLVTAGAQSLDAAPEGGAPLSATLWGFGRTLAVEQPELRGGLIDLDPGAPDAHAVSVLNELLAPQAERQVAFRRGQRHAARLERRAVMVQGRPRLRLRAEATYLITGGLGGLGLQLARRMAERGARHLVLVGRHAPAEPARAAIESIEALDARVLALRADVAQTSEVADVLAQIARDLPPLAGVIHAAGVLDDGVIGNQTWTRFANVLRPKVAGAWNVHMLTRAIPLDFFVLFSSAAAVLGSPGQASYAAANAFLDALAHRRRALGLPALSINWGPWAGEGMAGPGDTARRWAAVGLSPIEPEQGLDTLEYLLQQPGPATVSVLPANWPQFARQFPGGSPPLFAALAQQAGEQPASGQAAERQAFLNRLRAATPDRRLDLLAVHVREHVLMALKMPPAALLNPNQGLFELGMDSLTALEVRNQLQQSLGLALPATALFEHSTILDLANYLNELLAPPEPIETARADPNDEDAELAHLLAEVEALSEGEVDQALTSLNDQAFPDGPSA